MPKVADIQPLVIRGSDPAPGGRWLGRIAGLGLMALVAFAWKASKGDGVIRAPEPELNGFLQACWVLVPLIFGYRLSAGRVRVDVPDEEVEIPNQRPSAFSADWWNVALLWPAPLLGGVAVALAALELNADLGGYAVPPSSGAWTFALTLAIAVVWGDILFRRPRLFVAPGGLRSNTTHYLPWDDIDHVSDSGRRVGIHHVASPRLPFTTIDVADPAARAVVDRMIREHRLRGDDATGWQLQVVQLLTVAGALAELAGAVYALRVVGQRPLVVVSAVFVLGFVLTALLERMRGIGAITRQPKRVFHVTRAATPEEDAAGGKGSAALDPAEVGRTAAGTRVLRHTARRDVAFGDGGREDSKEKRSAHYDEWLGACETVWHELVPLDPHVDIQIHPPDAARNRAFHTLVTEGMSDVRMRTPPGVGADRARIELLVYVPSFQAPAPGSNEMPFPLGVLKQLARLPFDYDTWLFTGHTVPNGDPPAPYGPGSSLTTALLLPAISEPDGFTQGFTLDGDPVTFLSVVFLTAAETQLKLDRGLDALVDLWGEDIPWIVDPNRRSKV